MKLKSLVNKIEDHLIVVVLFSFTSLAVIEVIRRYVFSASTAWGEELVRFLFIFMVYVGCSSAIKYHRHIKIDFLVAKFSSRVQIIFLSINNILLLGFSLTIIFFGINWSISNFHAHITPGLYLPIGVFYLLVPFGFLFITYRLIEQLLFFIRIYNASEEDLDQKLAKFLEGGT